MNFKQWMQNEAIGYESWWSDGTIIVNIDGVSYMYKIDPLLAKKLEREVKYAPSDPLKKIKYKVLNQIKQASAALGREPEIIRDDRPKKQETPKEPKQQFFNF
jgi:hypothetical protein